MQKRGVPGLSLAVVQAGKITYAKGYGVADLENGVAATPDTVYEIGSLTKQFTAALILQLRDEGKFALDDSIQKYLPNVPDAWKGVTIRHLLTHTSGIKSYTSMPTFEHVMREPLQDGAFLSFVGAEKLEFAPGEKFSYDNSGYFLLGLLIEKITSKSYRDVLRERIFQPLGMIHSEVNDPSAIIAHRARGYEPRPGKGPSNATYIDMGWPYAAGALVSTVGDLAKWDAALYGDRPVQQTSWQQAWSPSKLNDGTAYPYGFGWSLAKLNGISTVEHGGEIPGFNSYILRVPEKKLTVIVLCNASPGIAEPLAREVAGQVDPSLKVELKSIPDPDAKTTDAHKELLLSLLQGTMKRELFTPQMQERLWPDFVNTARESLNEFGSLESFTFQGAEQKDGKTRRRYLVVIGGQALNFVVATNPDGKISGFSISPG